MILVEDTIQRVEKLYEVITGKEIQNEHSQRPPISAEVDPMMLLNVRMQELLQLMNAPAIHSLLQPQIPQLSAWESESHFLIKLDVPGVAKEDIDISVKGNALIVNARRKPMSVDKGFYPRRIESPSGNFHRTIILPMENATAEISSHLENGVLAISIPRQTTSNAKSVKKAKAQ